MPLRFALAGVLAFFFSAANAQFIHRGYLGWLTDLASEPRPYEAWPSIGIDETLFRDYDEAFRVLQEIGLNEISLWGLFVAREWPLDIEHTLDDARRAQVRRLIDMAHRRGLKVLSGLGVYSWGFEGIIRAHPELSRGNPRALCLHVPASWDWQRRVIDYEFSFPIDGVSLQSADQGRCQCADCPAMTDADYHAAVNQKVVQYIRQRYPGKLIGVSGWGMAYERPDDLPALKALTRNVDYFIEVRPGRPAFEPAFHRQLTEAIRPCAVGTTGTPNVEPPQHWARTRWFLPTARRAAEALQRLYADGGRAVENYFHPLANPGDEATLRLMAAVELHPEKDWRPQYRLILQTMFSPKNGPALDSLLSVFLRAEDAYVENVKQHQPTDIVRLEPLVGDHPGPPIYLRDAMTAEGRQRYKNALNGVLASAGRLRAGVGNRAKLERVLTGLRSALAEE